jgi:hypothetical protein
MAVQDLRLTGMHGTRSATTRQLFEARLNVLCFFQVPFLAERRQLLFFSSSLFFLQRRDQKGFGLGEWFDKV